MKAARYRTADDNHPLDQHLLAKRVAITIENPKTFTGCQGDGESAQVAGRHTTKYPSWIART
jgi:hypothetical protein